MALGFLALGYEMALFRVLALAHDPMPTTFATGLAGYLLAWSLGNALAGRITVGVPALAGFSAATLFGVQLLYDYETGSGRLDLVWAVALYSLPCLGFGMLYGQLVAKSARSWGRDVGRFAGANTVGSCAGILFFTLVGYEAPQEYGLHAMGVGLLAVAAAEAASRARHGKDSRDLKVMSGVATTVAAVYLGTGLYKSYTLASGARVYWGRDGVVKIDSNREVFLDGLWHTRLSDGKDHVGSKYSWLMAFAAAMAHENPHPKRALVIGGGVGISSATLSGIDELTIDVYEINHTLRRVHRDFAAGTLNSLNTPGVRWMWRDARTGMALDPSKYDIILSAPLYLRQAGSSLLLSREYLELAKSRLNPGGVLAVYSNEGSAAQTRLIQRTLAELFAHRVTWSGGLLTVASDQRIEMDREHLRARLALPDRLYREATELDASMQQTGGLFSLFDGTRHVAEQADQIITDDRPMIEYPELADRLVGFRKP